MMGCAILLYRLLNWNEMLRDLRYCEVFHYLLSTSIRGDSSLIFERKFAFAASNAYSLPSIALAVVGHLRPFFCGACLLALHPSF
jgi:hypothetical protein